MTTLPGTEHLLKHLDEYASGKAISAELSTIRWSMFLDLLQCVCSGHGWQIEYEDTNDYSVAIFAYDEVSVYQLSLFVEYQQAQASTQAHFS